MTYYGHSLLFLLLVTFHAVLVSADNGRDGGLAKTRVMVEKMWMDADTITLSIFPMNLTDHKILVFAHQKNDTSVTVVDTFLKPHNGPTSTHYKMDELQPNTMYEVCVALSSTADPHPGIVHNECYNVKTFPKVDNVRGVYAALVAAGVFLMVCGVTWILYITIWVKYFTTKTLDIQDRQQAEHPMESQPSSSPSQEVTISETESTISTAPTIKQ